MARVVLGREFWHELHSAQIPCQLSAARQSVCLCKIVSHCKHCDYVDRSVTLATIALGGASAPLRRAVQIDRFWEKLGFGTLPGTFFIGFFKNMIEEYVNLILGFFFKNLNFS